MTAMNKQGNSLMKTMKASCMCKRMLCRIFKRKIEFGIDDNEEDRSNETEGATATAN